ncbi:DUF6320 domain-containing protein [Brachybacterium aquaticum]|uniref:Zinc ribbon domain-containing protein n=1 Tax=Brachybacterium aquaticum TaxID=1432564 RepID=A0A841AH51_9MICO|nr:DUF6320 domain-containing protein [Brachybacterium aquaticum]MBB5832404.1 hypothetical protein [Brachybacterium aquaticum]
MRRCEDCRAGVEGDWTRCPLCGAELEAPADGDPAPAPHPDVPLRFSRRRVLRVLFLTSLAIIALSFAAQLVFRLGHEDIGAWRIVWLGIAALWLVVLMAVRKRSNLAKSIVYLVVLVGGVCVYVDYLAGWSGWALTFAVPILCAASVIGLLVVARVVRMEVGDYIVYSGLTVLLGLAPLVFLALGWVSTAIPSVICGALCLLATWYLLTVRGAEVRHELATRLHL